MKLLTTIATIAIILTPQVAQAADAHLKACTRTQVAALSAGIQTYESFLANIDLCKNAALERLNNGIKDTDNPEALKESQALQQSMEAVEERQENSRSSVVVESEVLLPAWN